MNSSDFLHKLRAQLNHQLPFVMFLKPLESAATTARVLGIFQQDDQLHVVSDFTESGFVMAPFDNAEPTIIFPETACTQQEVAFPLKPQETPSSGADITTDKQAKAEHISLVTQGIEAIKHEQFEKVVLSRQQSVTTNHQPVAIFKQLLQRYPTAFAYCWYHPKVGLWIGAIPETLVKISDRHFKTMALSGTKSAAAEPVREWTTKERTE